MTLLSTSFTPRCSNMISKYPVQYIPVVQEKKKATETRISTEVSRVLTSAECIAILREREEEKWKEKEEKKEGNKKD